MLSRYNGLAPDVRWRITFSLAFILGVCTLLLLGLLSEGPGKVQRTMAALLLAGASGAVGAFLGFLFGIPRSQQVTIAPNGGGAPRSYSENTNLEQISDWLTKIIVGLTLVQFSELLDMLKVLSAAYGPAIVNHSNAAVPQATAMAIVIYFLMAALFFVYLWTRIYVEALFRRQSVMLDNELEDLINQREEDANSQDAEALQLTDEFLDEKADPHSEKYKDIEKKIAESSFIARTLIFERAREARRKAWRQDRPEDAAKAIPIFRGLIAAAPGKYHRNYGQLGYAIVASPAPNWKEARKSLETAISLRGQDTETSGSGYYEFNLAIALINLDPDYRAGKPSAPAQRDRIAALLDAGRVHIPDLGHKAIKDWAKLNGYTI